MAEVTREHRAIAFPFWNMAARPEQVEGGLAYIETGAGSDSAFRFSEQIAQAIADAEARGRSASSAEVTRLEREVERLKRLASGIFAPCRQCGDATTLCVKSMCCIGCNHSAEEFAERYLSDARAGNSCPTLSKRVEARDSATRLALLEEYIGLVNARDLATPSHRLESFRAAYSELRAKYTQPVLPTKGEKL